MAAKYQSAALLSLLRPRYEDKKAQSILNDRAVPLFCFS
jgi:hypothetical protein